MLGALGEAVSEIGIGEAGQGVDEFGDVQGNSVILLAEANVTSYDQTGLMGKCCEIVVSGLVLTLQHWWADSRILLSQNGRHRNDDAGAP